MENNPDKNELMQYSEKYVAFIDILGFSNYVSDGENVEKVAKLFSFSSNFCYLFNSSPKLHTQASFFSDSIVLSSDDFGQMVAAIMIAESYIQKELNLLFRGGICKGEIFFQNGMLFGPAVVKSYRLENRAEYARIIIDDSVIAEIVTPCYEVFRDMDGFYCLNSFAMSIHERTAFGQGSPKYPSGDPSDILLDIFKNKRIELLAAIKKYKNNPVIGKYLWRITPFNYSCRFIAENPESIDIFYRQSITPKESFSEEMLKNQIQTAEIDAL